MYQLYAQLERGLEVRIGYPMKTMDEVTRVVSRMRVRGQMNLRVAEVVDELHVDDCLCPDCLERRRRDRGRQMSLPDQ